MSHPDDDTRRALARCEERYLREPERGNDDGCDECGEPLPDGLHLCDECAAVRDDDSATPYGGAMPADDADVIPFP